MALMHRMYALTTVMFVFLFDNKILSNIEMFERILQFLLNEFKWSIFVFSQLLTLWSWLPVRITMYQPILLYTTEEHGCSLTTFYVRVENHEPTLLMIKTCNNEVSNCSVFIYIFIHVNCRGSDRIETLI